jgi:outer membrane protein TolC
VRTALAENPSLSLAQKDVAISNARRRISTASLFPALSLKADDTRGRSDEDQGNVSFVQRSYGIQATQTLFSGGKLWADWRRSSLGAEVSRLQLEKQRLEVRHAVAEAYWRVVALEKSMSIYNEAHRRLQEDLEKAVRHELSASRNARIELLTVRVQNRQCESALAETDEKLNDARTALLDALGEVRQIPFQVPLEIPSNPVRVEEEEALRLARSHRLEWKIAEKMMKSAALSRRVTQSAYFPRVDLNGFWGRSGAAFVATDPLEYRRDWNAGVRVTWPLMGNTFLYSAYRDKTSPKLGESSRTETESQSVSVTLGDALAGSVEKLEGKKAFEEEQWRYEKSQRDMELEVRLAVRRVKAAWKSVEAANAKAEEALQQFKDVRSLLREDRAHLGDIASARNRVAFAQAEQSQAQAQHLIAVSGLNRAIGVAENFQVPVK